MSEILRGRDITSQFHSSLPPDVVLPVYSFNKGAQLFQEENDFFVQHLYDANPDWGAKPIDVGSEMQGELQELLDHQIQWVNNTLGIDISKRRIPMHKIKLFGVSDWDEIRQRLGKPEGWSGGNHFPTRDIATPFDQTGLLAHMNHEMVHGNGRHTVFLDKEVDDESKSITLNFRNKNGLSGFNNNRNGSFHYFNEVMTEMINLEMLSSYKEDTKKDYLSEYQSGYHNGVILFDDLNEEAAKRLGRDAKEIRDDLYRGYFEGNMTVLRVYQDAFGIGALKTIGDMKGSTYEDFELSMLPLRLKVYDSKFFDQTKLYDEGEKVRVLGGIPIGKTLDVSCDM
jgi:hypothetical protein